MQNVSGTEDEGEIRQAGRSWTAAMAVKEVVGNVGSFWRRRGPWSAVNARQRELGRWLMKTRSSTSAA